MVAATITRQPDYRTDFADYADYVTTGWFLLSHVLASIAGTALGVIGVVALAVVIAVDGGRRDVRRATVGAAAFVTGSVLVTSVFGAAAFAQPAIGRAHQSGLDVAQLNADVYGPVLFAVAGVGLLFYLVGAVVIGWTLSHGPARLRRPGLAFAWLTGVFVLAGFVLDVLQPLAALGLVVTTTVIARRLR
jgi:hypothetical protein